MSVLSAENHQEVEQLLVGNGVLDVNKLDEYRQAAKNEKKALFEYLIDSNLINDCLLYTSPSPRDATLSRMPSSA